MIQQITLPHRPSGAAILFTHGRTDGELEASTVMYVIYMCVCRASQD